MEGVGTIEMSLRMGVWWLGDMRVVGAGGGRVVRVCIRSDLTGIMKEFTINMFCFN